MGFLKNRKLVGIIVAALFMVWGTLAFGRMLINYAQLVENYGGYDSIFDVYSWNNILYNVSILAFGVIVLIMELTGQHRAKIHLAVYIAMAAIVTLTAIDVLDSLKDLFRFREFRTVLLTTSYFVTDAALILSALMLASNLIGKPFLKNLFFLPAVLYLAGTFTSNLIWGFSVESFITYIVYTPIYVVAILGLCYWATMFMTKNPVYATGNQSYVPQNQPYVPEFRDNAGMNNGANDVERKLQRLRELVNDGIITEEEFEAKKRELLGL